MIHFFSSCLELTQMTRAQGKDIFSVHRQSLCQVLVSNNYILQEKALTRIIHFFYIDIEQLTFSQVQVHDTSSGYKQFVCEVGTSIFLHKKGIEQTQIKYFFFQ